MNEMAERSERHERARARNDALRSSEGRSFSKFLAGGSMDIRSAERFAGGASLALPGAKGTGTGRRDQG